MVTKLVAPNPSPMTLEGTNGYIVEVGPGALVAIDPGIDDPVHIASFVRAAHDASARYAAILVTHGHPDHAPGALALRRETGAPVMAHPDAKFPHDRALENEARLTFEDETIVVIHAPGHAHDHLVFWAEKERALFTGDVVIGRGTVVIAPPSGDMRAYMATLKKLSDVYGEEATTIHGGHGPTIRNPSAKLREYIEHRKAREAQIVDVLREGPATIPELVADIYADVSQELWPAAARQVLAYLIALGREGRVAAERISRPLTVQESYVLNPQLKGLGSPTELAVIRAELGFGHAPEPLVRFSLVS
jgi:glyoxylase-like metal-dependent hydrolase (beta-lactamase superfamily II)